MKKLGKWGRRWCILAAVVLIVAIAFLVFRQTPYYYPVRSYVVLKAMNIADSVSTLWNGKDKICVRLPDGRSTPETDWTRQISVYRPGDDFAAYMGQEIELTILYNFGAFTWGNPYAAALDPDSPYYSAYYGAYIVKDPQGPFGFTEEGAADPEKLALITSYDWSDLVLSSLGCSKRVTAQDFLNGDLTAEENVTYAGLTGWSRMDCVFEARGLWHTYQQNQLGYLQLGIPPAGSGEDFAPITLYGRVYARYLDNYDVTLYLYVMTADRQILEDCDARFLSHVEIL